jgi:hypothetical protein
MRASGALVVLLVIAGGCATPVPSVSKADTPVPTQEDASSAPPSGSPFVSPAPPSNSPSSPSPAPPTTGTGGPSTDRFADGIPRAVDGEPVLRGAEAIALAARKAAAADTTPFLVGGWVTYEPGDRFCTIGSVGPNVPWSHDCIKAAISDVAGALQPKLTTAVTFHFVLTAMASGGGPVVARVGVHDPRASSCGTAAAACDRMMVVQQVVWAGDAGTAPRPISLDAALRALARLQPGASLAPGSSFCGDALPAA